jgi:putative ABC transport system substrate-binding protein
MELLKELMPQMTRAAVLVNPGNPTTMGPELQAIVIAAQSLKVELQQFPVRGPNELDSAFERMEQGHAEAVVISDEGMLLVNGKAIAALATKRRLLSAGSKEFAQAGGLMGYGVDLVATYRRAAVFVDKILKGTKPSDIPIEQATRFQFVLNLNTAKALDVAIPTSIMLRADEVIE